LEDGKLYIGVFPRIVILYVDCVGAALPRAEYGASKFEARVNGRAQQGDATRGMLAEALTLGDIGSLYNSVVEDVVQGRIRKFWIFW